GIRRRKTKIDETASVSKMIAPNMAKSVMTSNSGLPWGTFRSTWKPAILNVGTWLEVRAVAASTSNAGQAASIMIALAGVWYRGCTWEAKPGARWSSLIA